MLPINNPSAVEEVTCPAQGLLKMLAGKLKPEVFRLAVDGPVRFNTLLKVLDAANKQTLSVVLKEFEEEGLFERVVVKLKPLHVEYKLTTKGLDMLPIFRELERAAKNSG